MGYGKLEKNISMMESSLNDVLSTWKDSVGSSFQQINENMKKIAVQVTADEENSIKAHKMVKDNYHKEDIDSSLNRLGSRIAGL